MRTSQNIKLKSLVAKASEANELIETLIKENTFTSGDISLILNYSPWNKKNYDNDPFDYLLKKGNSSYISFSFEQIKELKDFLNSITFLGE